MKNDLSMLQHLLVSISYRFSQAIKGAPTNYPSFEQGEGVRAPLVILGHMNGVLAYAEAILKDETRQAIPDTDWQDQTERFQAKLQSINTLLGKQAYDTDTLERLLQGPLADVLTHIGQLAMLRRLSGSAIKGENFFEANIKTQSNLD